MHGILVVLSFLISTEIFTLELERGIYQEGSQKHLYQDAPGAEGEWVVFREHPDQDAPGAGGRVALALQSTLSASNFP